MKTSQVHGNVWAQCLCFTQSSVFFYFTPVTGCIWQGRQWNHMIMEFCYSICKQWLGYILETLLFYFISILFYFNFIFIFLFIFLLKILSFLIWRFFFSFKDLSNQCQSFGSWQPHSKLHLCNYNLLKTRERDESLMRYDWENLPSCVESLMHSTQTQSVRKEALNLRRQIKSWH